MKNILELTSQQLRRAAQIKEQIASLERQMQNLLGQAAPASPGNRGMSAAARAKISAAAKARWAKIRSAKQGQAPAAKAAAPATKPVQKSSGRKPMSAAQKAKIAATLKARRAKIKAAKK